MTIIVIVVWTVGEHVEKIGAKDRGLGWRGVGWLLSYPFCDQSGLLKTGMDGEYRSDVGARGFYMC